jgi:hypothetical protein
MVKSDHKKKPSRKVGASSSKPDKKLTWEELPEDVKMFLEMKVEETVDDLLTVEVKPGTRIPLNLTEGERDLILNEAVISTGLSEKQIKKLESAQQPKLQMTLDDWEDFHGYVAAEANHCTNRKRQERLQSLSDSISLILRRTKESED